MLQYKRKPAEITVFLALICIVLFSLILVLIKSAKITYLRTRIEGSTDVALVSSFSEYNKMLFDKYHLLFVDTTYKGVLDGGDDSFKEHFSQYMELNLYGDDMSYGLELVSSDISGTVYANSDSYSHVVSQIRFYVTGISGALDVSDDEVIDEYINSCIGNYIDIELYDDIYEWSYDEKLMFVIDTIEKDMNESYGSFFDFSKHLYSAEVTAYVSSDLSKMYECTKYYSLK